MQNIVIAPQHLAWGYGKALIEYVADRYKGQYSRGNCHRIYALSFENDTLKFVREGSGCIG